MKKSLEKICALFFLFGFLFIPLTLNGKDFQFQFTHILFSKPVAFLEKRFFSNALPQIDFSSDTISLLLLIILLFFLAITIVFVLKFTKFKLDKIVTFSRVITCYYIAFILFKYGFDKVFKAQFYLPEPNILYTNFGDLSKDILYWSTIGTSHFYSVSMGIIEVLVAILILIKRTRILGLLLAIGVFVNIILINFGFDISVKIFSIFLFLATIFAVFPCLKVVFNFFILQKKEQLSIENLSFTLNPIIKIWLKIMIVGVMLLQILFPYFQSNNFNDDNAKRNFLHGAYQVTEIIKGNDTLKFDEFPIEKIFVHRNNYLIFQDNNQQMTDYHFEINKLNNQLLLEDYAKNKILIAFKFSQKDAVLKLNFNKYHIVCKAINWRKLPALHDKIHFSVDEIR